MIGERANPHFAKIYLLISIYVDPLPPTISPLFLILGKNKIIARNELYFNKKNVGNIQTYQSSFFSVRLEETRPTF